MKIINDVSGYAAQSRDLKYKNYTSRLPRRPASRQDTAPNAQFPYKSAGSFGSARPRLNIGLQAVKYAPCVDSDTIHVHDESCTSVVKRTASRSKLKVAFYGFGVIAIFISLTASIQSFLGNRNARETVATLGAADNTPDEQGIVEGSGTDPSEDDVTMDAVAGYQVSADYPRYIRIPSLNVSARVKQTGRDKVGAVDAPWNVHDVSWFNESVLPGAPQGTSLLLGHVSGYTKPGVFKRLQDVRSEDTIEIEKGNGSILTYVVVSTDRIAVQDIDMSKILATDAVGEQTLKLMTCVGAYDSGTDSYSERLVVHAKLVR